MTRGEIIFEVALEFGLDSEVGSNELKLMQRWVNKGVEDVLLKTNCYVDEGDMTLDSGVTDYRIDENILAVDGVHVVGQTRPLAEKPAAWIDRYLLSNVAPCDPMFYTITGTFMRVAPAPSSAAVLRFYYVPRPLAMLADGTLTADGNDPSNPTYGGIPDEYHDAIQFYVNWRAAKYDDKGGGFSRGNASSPGQSYFDDYRRRIKEIRKELRQKGARGLHAGVVGYPDEGWMSNSNSAYPGWNTR